MIRTLGTTAAGLRYGLLACLLAATPGTLPRATPASVLEAEEMRSLRNGVLARALSGGGEALAARAALAIGRTKQISGEALLVPHLRDRRAAVRALSLYAIGLIASGRQPAAISDGLRDRNGAVRVAALDASDRYETLHRFDVVAERHVLGRVAAMLAGDRESVVRARAAAVLESFNVAPSSAIAVSALASAAQRDRAVRVRRYAMWALFRGYAKVAPRGLLSARLRDPDEVVRIEAVRAFGKRGDAADVSVVRPLLADPSWRVQEQAAETVRLLQKKAPTQHWTRIPSYVHVPAPQLDPLRDLPPVAMTAGPRAKPAASRAILLPAIDPTTASAMDGPAPGLHPRVRIVTTKGNLYVVLYPEWAPLTVENFLNLAARGYYSHNRWFRIVPDFVVQTGDRNDNGNGDAGYSLPSEENPLVQDSYVISMGLNYTNPPNAHAIRDSAGAQYYVTLSPQLHLDRDFSVFGQVTSGYDVLGRLIESDRVLRIERIADNVVR